MELYRSFLGAEVCGDLLVEKSFYHQPEHLRLTRRECDESMLQLATDLARLAQLHALNEARRHSAEQIVLVEWLEQEIRCPAFHARDAALDVRKARHEDDGHRAARFVDRALHIEPRKVRHPDVENQTAGHIGVGPLEELRGGRIGLDVVPGDA